MADLIERLLAKPDRACHEAATRIKELEADLEGREAVADSYAEENQRLSDERDAIEAATIERCAKAAEEWIYKSDYAPAIAASIRALKSFPPALPEKE